MLVFLFYHIQLIPLCSHVACENEISTAVTERKQAEMRLKSAQSELREKEKACREGEASYSRDKATLETLQKEVAKIEVRNGLRFGGVTFTLL